MEMQGDEKALFKTYFMFSLHLNGSEFWLQYKESAGIQYEVNVMLWFITSY